MIKQKIKEILATIEYFLYRNKWVKNKFEVLSLDDTIEKVVKERKSLIRFGDGEIAIIRGRNIGFQSADELLAQKLEHILTSDSNEFLLAIPNIFVDLEFYDKETKKFWMQDLVVTRRYYNKYCRNKVYCDAFFSRVYMPYLEKEKCKSRFEKIKSIWENQKVLIVEGQQTRFGVGNDLLQEAREVNRILGPAQNAYKKIDEIIECILKYIDDYNVVLVALGPAAKVVVYELAMKRHLAIDVGHLDIEYEWFRMGSQKKVQIKDKFTNEAESKKLVENCMNQCYLDEIIVDLEG